MDQGIKIEITDTEKASFLLEALRETDSPWKVIQGFVLYLDTAIVEAELRENTGISETMRGVVGPKTTSEINFEEEIKREATWKHHIEILIIDLQETQRLLNHANEDIYKRLEALEEAS